MNKYPLIEKWLGLEIYKIFDREVISPIDLETKLAEGIEVYGYPEGIWCGPKDKESCDNHIGLVIGVQPIKKKTKEEAALEFVEKISKDVFPYVIIQEAKAILEMK